MNWIRSVLVPALPSALLLLAPPLHAQGSDNCSTAQVISGAGPFSFDLTAATTGTDGQANAACNLSGSMAILNDVWFRWTAPSSGKFIISSCQQTLVDTKIAVYPGIACPPGAPVFCDDDWGYTQALAEVNATLGQTFTIQLGDSPNSGVTGTGTFRILAVAPSTNDSCAMAASISGQGFFGFDGTGATTGTEGQANPGCFAIPQDVWYSWTAPMSGMAQVDTCGQSSSDTRLAVYSGSGCPGAFSLACDDDACNLQSQVQWTVTSGSLYTIQIGGGGYGTFRVEVSGPPANDNCATPVNINVSGGSYDNTLATTGAQGQGNPCGAIQKDLWFTWTASMNGTATIGTCFTTAIDTKLAVYAGSGCPGALALDCNDDNCTTVQSEVTIPISAGSTYTIQVGSPPGGSGGPAALSVIENPSGGPMTPFCFPGQSGVIPCPCGNPPTASGRGCNNFGTGPVASCELTATGNASIANDTLVFTSTGENNTSLTIFIQAPNTTAAGLVFGAGVRCASGPLKRLYSGSASGGTISRPQGADPSVHTRSAALGDTLASGVTRHYFPYYRDPNAAGPCSNPASTFNCGNSGVGSSRVDLQACKLEYSIVSPK